MNKILLASIFLISSFSYSQSLLDYFYDDNKTSICPDNHPIEGKIIDMTTKRINLENGDVKIWDFNWIGDRVYINECGTNRIIYCGPLNLSFDNLEFNNSTNTYTFDKNSSSNYYKLEIKYFGNNKNELKLYQMYDDEHIIYEIKFNNWELYNCK